ncbi:MAG: hypothetical protein IKH45_07225, partial [Neisseriaceae bacterium]|nr:hypothetical protein [Neisseriaceae bacterium]
VGNKKNVHLKTPLNDFAKYLIVTFSGCLKMIFLRFFSGCLKAIACIVILYSHLRYLLFSLIIKPILKIGNIKNVFSI